MIPVSYARGRVVGRFALPPYLDRVRAGLPSWPIYAESFRPSGDRSFYTFLLYYDDLSELGYFAGDTILIDESMTLDWSDEDYDGKIVLVATHFGELVGQYLHGRTPSLRFHDRKGTLVLWTPEMEIKGVAHFGWKDVGYNEKGDATFL